MNKKNTKSTKTVAPKSAAQPSRIDRWRMIAEKELARSTSDIRGVPSLLSVCAEIEGTDPVSLVVSKIAAERGGGKTVKKCPLRLYGPQYNAFVDTDCEINETERRRDGHEHEIVMRAINDFTDIGPWLPKSLLVEHGEAFLRKFYRKGDCGSFTAYVRMVRDAMMRCSQ